MTKLISSGILVKVGTEYVVGHASGCPHFDIFKGRHEEGETALETAIRECKEESGLQFSFYDVKHLGFYNYTKKKDLNIYIAKLKSLDMTKLKCTTYLDNGLPEMDYYEKFDFDTLVSKLGNAMSIIVKSLQNQIEEF